jgi:hypothetical protein
VIATVIYAVGHSVCFADLSGGLIAYYPMNGDALEYSGHGHHAIAHNLVASSNRLGIADNAWSFNGTNGYISIPSSPELTLVTNFSVSLWIFQRAAQLEGYRLVDKAYAGQTNGIVVDTYGNFGGGSGRRLRIQTGTVPGVAINVVGSTEYSLMQWHHVVATISGTTGRLYLDGKLDGTGNVGRITQNSLEIFIGRAHPFSGSGDAQWFNGIMDDIRLYNRPLFASEVSELYNLERSRPENPPMFAVRSLMAGLFRYELNPLLPGQRIILQASTNLAAWSPVQTNVPTTATLAFTNYTSPAVGYEFFRALIQ